MARRTASRRGVPDAGGASRTSPNDGARCCPQYHEAVELVGRRWTGAILEVMLQAGGPVRFSQVAHAVPQLSDRLLSERLKELERRGVVERRVDPGPPTRVEYALTEMGLGLRPALAELKAWARRWLDTPAN